MAPISENVLGLLDLMEPIELSEMRSIKLMNRIDTKYIATEQNLAELLEMARGDYRVQAIEGKRTGLYNTIYYDTEGADMYLLHHNQKLQRQKIRTRTYVDSGIAFLEIKNKSNKGRTKKVRTQIALDDFSDFVTNPVACDFIYNQSDYPLRHLSPHVRTSFERITLVNKRKTERLTIDTNLTFGNFRTGLTRELPPVAIIEVKQDGMAYSEMTEILLTLRIQQCKISKYCVGTALTNPALRSNRFKERIHYIEKITNL
jgi:hypothetical protein